MLPGPTSLWPSASFRQAAPASEPITVLEAQEHLRVDQDDDWDVIDGLIKAARTHVEEEYHWALITQTWDAYYSGFPPSTGELVIPRPPLQSVTEVEYTTAAGTPTTLSASLYNVDTNSKPGRITLKRDESWPADSLDTGTPIRVRFVAGYGAAFDVPESIRHALKLLVDNWYEHRGEGVVGTVIAPLPFAVRTLLGAHRGPVIA